MSFEPETLQNFCKFGLPTYFFFFGSGIGLGSSFSQASTCFLSFDATFGSFITRLFVSEGSFIIS